MSSLSTTTNTGGADFLFGSGIAPQILFALVAGIILFIILFSIESLIKTFNGYKTAKTILVSDTVLSNRAIVLRQDPSDPLAKTILPSDNQLTGVEFTYSFFLFIEPSTFEQGTSSLKQVFYKGYQKPFPLLGPGVFIKSNENTMRVFMNSYKNWYSYVDIKNVPVQKWFHVSLVFRSNNLEVYVNGNLTGRISMEDTYPYQNYQSIILFGSSKYISAKKYKSPTGEEETFQVTGAISGQISRLYHYRYALSFSEIQANVNQGPSQKVEQASDATFYSQSVLRDNWYTSGQ
jgi:hypothetical protein